MRLGRFIGELKRRHVFRVALMYAAAGVGVLAVASDVANAMELPGWVPRAVIFVTLLGFPLTLVLAWAFDLTAEGVKSADEQARVEPAPEPAFTPAPAAVASAAAARAAPGGSTMAVRIPRVVAPVPAQRPTSASESEAAAEPVDPDRVRRAALAHIRNELRTPINAILGYSEMLLEDVAARGEEDVIADLRSIHSAGKQLLSLVDETLHPDRASVSEIERDAEGFGARLRHDLRNPINAIIGYSEMLIEAGEETGRTELIPDLQRVLASARQLLRLTQEVVQFAGAGSEHDVAQTGLSSEAEAIAREVIAKIRPLKPDAAQAADLHPGSLLVVDDNATNRDLLSRQLARQGYTVSTARSGSEALEMLHAQDFDLVLLDILMPGMSGIEVLQRMKGSEALQDIPVIMVSALDEVDSVVRCIEMGAVDYLSKPFDPVLLGTRIGTSLQMRRLHDQERVYQDRLRQADEVVERVLLSLCPAPVAARLRSGETAFAETYPEATVLCANLEGPAKLAARGKPGELFGHLGRIFRAFDALAEEIGIETVCASGRSYVAATGVPTPRPDHAAAVAELALAMVRETQRYATESGEPFRIRIGVHSGSLVAGVVDTGRLGFHLWGDAVDTAGALESAGAQGGIHVSSATQARLQDRFDFESRGVLEVPGKGQMRTYFLRGSR